MAVLKLLILLPTPPSPDGITGIGHHVRLRSHLKISNSFALILPLHTYLIKKEERVEILKLHSCERH